MQTAPVDERPLPPVDRVRPGLWSIPVPLPIVLHVPSGTSRTTAV